MSGGDVRVLRQEAGQESPRMPAWKREILERRKAKGGGSGAGAAEAYPSGCAQRVNGEVTGNGSGLKKDNGIGAGSNKSYTITTASQHFASKRGNLASPDLSPVKTNKDPWSAADPPDALENMGREDDGHESLVLQDSLGPLQENPFIKLEKERKRQQDIENATRPVQHILELYGSVPGIRTIRAENIIIIESDPGYFPEAGSKSQQNGVSSYSSLNDLLDRRGSAVTEIRAKEVVIYDTTLSKSEENLSTLGRPDHDGLSYEAGGGGRGRVSRILQKFDSNYGKLQKKSHSTENLLDLESSSSGGPRLRPKPQPVLVPKPSGSQPPRSPVRKLDKQTQSVFQTSPPSSTAKPRPADADSGGPGGLARPAEPPESVSSVCQRYEGRGGASGGTAPVSPAAGPQLGPSPGERDWEGLLPKPKVPCSPEAAASYRKTSNFEIRPSPKPDLSAIPDGDAQARALANLRLQSRNSFTVIPKRHPASSKSPPAPSGVPTPQPPSPTRRAGSKARAGRRPLEEEVVKAGGRSLSSSTAAAKSSKPDAPHSPVTAAPVTPELSPAAPPLTPAVLSPHLPSPPPPSPPIDTPAPCPAPSVPDSPSPVPEDTGAEQLPVTNIDDIEVERPQPAPGPASSPAGQRRIGKTFTVVPKRKVESELQPSPPELRQEVSGGGQAGATSPQAPYAQLGSLLKKRYPAVEEIEVIGGYLSLGRSCLTKTGSVGKKLKISFNEASLQSTYEYPSEGSVWDSEDEDDEDGDEEEGGKAEERVSDDQPSMVGRIHIPRPSFTTSPANSTDLSNYVPKHSVDFTAWQEHRLDDPVYQGDNSYQQTPMSGEVMLTPADSSSLSDFNSEPALYF